MAQHLAGVSLYAAVVCLCLNTSRICADSAAEQPNHHTCECLLDELALLNGPGDHAVNGHASCLAAAAGLTLDVGNVAGHIRHQAINARDCTVGQLESLHSHNIAAGHTHKASSRPTGMLSCGASSRDNRACLDVSSTCAHELVVRSCYSF